MSETRDMIEASELTDVIEVKRAMSNGGRRSASPLIPRVISLSMALASLLIAGRASAADVFRYQDRTGRVHLVDLGALGTVAPTRSGASADAKEVSGTTSSSGLPGSGSSDRSPGEGASGASDATAASTPSTVRASARIPVVATPVVAPSLETNPAAIPYYSIVLEAASTYSLPPELLLAVIRVESNFNPRAVSRKGAMGLMQLMPATAASLGVSDPYDPRQNIMGGARFLRTLVNDFDGEVSLAVAAYNAGAGAVRRAGGIPGNPETQGYVPLVMVIYRAYATSGVARAAGM